MGADNLRAEMIRATHRSWPWTSILTALTLVFGPCLAEGAEQTVINDKTLVAWVAPANLTQRGGSVLTVERSGGVFDAIVLGELEPAKWMAGSNGFARTQQEQQGYPTETADGQTLVQIAMVYQGHQITIYRNGHKYADYTAEGAERFDGNSLILMGLRHQAASRDNCWFTGSIDNARVYGVALSADQLAALKPNQPSDPTPLAWWDFEDGKASDRMQIFPTSTLVGDARLAGGRLQLDHPGAYLMASQTLPVASSDLNEVDSTARALREKLLSDPHRPGYHFVTPEGRCMPFDPNGAIFWKGRYHLFYIFQDARAQLGTRVEHRPVSLATPSDRTGLGHVQRQLFHQSLRAADHVLSPGRTRQRHGCGRGR